jgi:hypothetical protein
MLRAKIAVEIVPAITGRIVAIAITSFNSRIESNMSLVNEMVTSDKSRIIVGMRDIIEPEVTGHIWQVGEFTVSGSQEGETNFCQVQRAEKSLQSSD